MNTSSQERGSLNRVKHEAHSLMGQYHLRVIYVVLLISFISAILPFFLLFSSSYLLSSLFSFQSCLPLEWQTFGTGCCVNSSSMWFCGALFLVFVFFVSFGVTRHIKVRRFQRSALFSAFLLVLIFGGWYVSESLPFRFAAFLGASSFFVSFWGYRSALRRTTSKR